MQAINVQSAQLVAQRMPVILQRIQPALEDALKQAIGQEITAPRLSSSPDAQQLQGVRGWFKRAVAVLLMVTLTLSSTGQAIAQASNLITGSNGRPYTGYRADGTYVQAGRTDSSHHQQVQDYHLLQHQLQNPALWTTSAVALSSSTNPDFVQMTIDQMMAAIAPTGTYAPGEAEPGGLYLGRLYLNINNPYLAGAGVLSAPPADAPESGATPPTGPLIDNYQHYALALAYAQSKAGGGASGDEPTGGWQSSVDGQYVGKSHEDSANSLKGKAFNDFIGKAVFQGAQDPLGGATAFFLIQGEQAKTHLSHLQQQQGGQLGSPILYTQQTLGLGQSPSGCGGRDSAPCPDLVQNFFNNVGSGPAPSEDERSTTLARFGLKEQDFVLGYIRGDGLAHDFEDGLGNLHFKNVGQSEEKLGEQLRQGAQQHWLGQQAAGAIDFGAFKADRELFLQGVNPYGYVNKADHWLLNGLRNGSIQPGHPDYERARALAEQGFRSAYAAQVEYGFRPTFTKEGAAYQANKLELNTYSDSQFFEDGLYLYKNISQHDRELLDGLRHGLIKPGDALYNEARALAEARYRAAFQKALEPPKKSDPIKQLVAVVVAVVAAWVIGPMVTQWAAGFVPGATATVGAGASASSVLAGTMGTTATVGSVVATGIGSTVAGMASAAINTTIVTGDLGKGLDAAGKALTSGVVSTAINALVPGLGITSEIATKAINTAAIAAGTTAAYGGSFGDNLLQAAINAGTDAVAESAANWIGSTFAEGSLGNYAAHAALGCAAGAARGDSSEGCGAGAAGAVVGNWAGQQVHQNLNSNDPNTLLVAAAGLDGQSFNSVGALASNLAGGFAGALVGGSSGNTQGNFFNGGAAGQNAFENNYLNHVQLSQRDKELAACTSDQCRQDVRARWNAVSEEQQSSTRENIASSGTAERERVQDQLASDMQGLVGRRSELQAELDSATNAQQRAQLSQQISETDNHIRQVANLGKDNLELLYQATGNLDYRRASANLNAATNGNELADALMAGAAIMGGGKGSAAAGGSGKAPAAGSANHLPKLPNNGVDYEKISTAGKGQSATPRDLNEQVVFNNVIGNPASGKPLPGLNSDPRFQSSDGFQKMEVTHKLPDGSNITVHYQYHSGTNRAYDVKIVTPQRAPPALQPGASIAGE
ncbi:DUF637 domain-containing protein [Hydrogenophaga electricum]|nr:DUF637 domain-containing protein [Hydrogenophaga electricum]